MSEDHSINRNQKKKEDGRAAPDFFGSLGKGMLEKEDIETLETSPGLTPLGFGAGVRDRVVNRCSVSEGFSITENTGIFQNSSGLSPLRPFGEIHIGNLKSSSLDRGFSTTEFTENTELIKNSPGLSPRRPFVKAHKKEVLE
jgi:hypothetical protein